MNFNINGRMIFKGREFLMNIVLLLFCIAAFYNIEWMSYNTDYLSVQQTKNLKGIFTITVVFHHLATFAGVGEVYNMFLSAGYIAVGGFLFISGYGLMYQYMHKGRNYIKTFPKRRILTIIIPAVIMAIVYFILKKVMYGYTLNTLLYDFRRGVSVISNGWYVTAIIYFYIALFVSMILSELIKKPRFMSIFIFIATFVYMVVCRKLNFEDHWFNAAFAFYFVVLWAMFKSKIDSNLKKSIYVIVGCIIGFYYLFNVIIHFRYGWMEFKCLMYLAIIVMLGMKIKLQSPFMEWVGDHSFEIYLVHGLFFDLLRNKYINLVDGFSFMLTLFILTFVSSYILHKMFTYMAKKITNC